MFVKAYTSIANLARDLGQLQRTLNEQPYRYSLQNLKPGVSVVFPSHPLTEQQMYPLDPRFVDVSDACHSAMTRLLYSSRCEKVLSEMGKGKKDSIQAKNRLEFMRSNNVLPPSMPSFLPISIKNHRHISTQAMPTGKLCLNQQTIRNGQVHAFDPNLEYLVAFEVSTVKKIFLRAPFLLFDTMVCDRLAFSRDYRMIKMRGCLFLMAVLPAAEDVLRSSTLTSLQAISHA